MLVMLLICDRFYFLIDRANLSSFFFLTVQLGCFHLHYFFHLFVVWTVSKALQSMLIKTLMFSLTEWLLFLGMSHGLQFFKKKCTFSYIAPNTFPISAGSGCAKSISHHCQPKPLQPICPSLLLIYCVQFNFRQQFFIASTAKSLQQYVVVHTAQV